MDFVRHFTKSVSLCLLAERGVTTGEKAKEPKGVTRGLSPRRLLDETDYSSSPPRWTPVVTAIVWQRMLKILGNINKISVPAMHAEAMQCLQKTWKTLVEVCKLIVSRDLVS